MRAAGLKAIDTVLESTAILIKSKNTKNDLVNLITSRIRGVISKFSLARIHTDLQEHQLTLLFLLAAKKYVLCQYNIPRNLLASAAKITPGKRAPTTTALEEDGWVAVSSMVEKKSIATVMDELAMTGATDILVLNIANSRTK
jgi:ATP phosphoribosyltransferase-like protein